MPSASLAERFWSKVDKNGEGGCWLWIASLKPKGYGQFRVAGKTVYAHRLAYELEVGTIPDKMTLDHLCRVKRCVNPAHMEVVTRWENQRRGFAAITHCPSNHEFTAENTGHFPGSGHRYCRTCVSARNRAAYLARTA